MRNRDMPAIPSEQELYFGKEDDGEPIWLTPLGLTKLEAAAIAAMQGVLANNDYTSGEPDKAGGKYVARNAVYYARHLFDELDPDERIRGEEES